MESKHKRRQPQEAPEVTVLNDGLTIVDQSAEKYARGSLDFNSKKIKHKKLRKTMEETHERMIHSAARTAATEILHTSSAGSIEAEGEQKIYKLTQRDITAQVDLNTAKKAFNLQLVNFGSYNLNFSRNGRYYSYFSLYLIFYWLVLNINTL